MSLVIKVNDADNIEYVSRNDNFAKNSIKSPANDKANGNRKSIFAGDLIKQEGSALDKRKEAQKRAMKVVKDTWDSDREIDEMIQKRRENSSQLSEKSKELKDSIKKLAEEKSELKDIYKINEDSDEQKDLELLEKRQNFESGDTSRALTPEEAERLKEIDKNPLTEYQERSLKLNDRMNKLKSDLRDAESEMMDDYANIRSIKLERLKSNPMVGAQKEAQDIIKAAAKEIISDALNEAKEQIDEKMEEEKEKSEEISEKKENEEELKEYIEEKRAIQEAFIEGTIEAVKEAEEEQRRNDAPELDIEEMLDTAMGYNGSKSEVQKTLEEIKSDMAILEADLKGIQVDEEI